MREGDRLAVARVHHPQVRLCSQEPNRGPSLPLSSFQIGISARSQEVRVIFRSVLEEASTTYRSIFGE